MDLVESSVMDITFPFSERKAAAAASLLLQLAGGQMEYLKLIKLLYYADRESLDRLGRPISGDHYFSMRLGPVLSKVYDLIKATLAGTAEQGPWVQQIGMASRYVLKLNGPADFGPLSDAEIRVLYEVFNRLASTDKWAVVNETHQGLPEWEDPGESRERIDIETILRVLGKSEEEIEQIRVTAAESQDFAALFGS